MSSLVGGTGIIGQDMVCGLNGKYKTFEGTEIVAENCVKARVKDLVVEGKTIQDPEDLSNIESVTEKENNILSVKINDNTTTLNLPIPLRSLPNGTCDTIEGNKLVQRVGKVTLDENTKFNFPTSLIMANTVLIGLTISSIPKVYDSTISAICDKLQFKNIYNLDESGFFIDKTGTKLWLRLSISIYGSTLEVIKTNLALNPITIYYPLATPIIHNLEIPSISTVRGTIIITTENNIKPKLKLKVKVKK